MQIIKLAISIMIICAVQQLALASIIPSVEVEKIQGPALEKRQDIIGGIAGAGSPTEGLQSVPGVATLGTIGSAVPEPPTIQDVQNLASAIEIATGGTDALPSGSIEVNLREVI
ncbi:uncharacterized protein VTP21DRAFT_5961 [Calcarisporiella thermophila]|uniref:uncharacterized protein n=1 Tax=Calcarisporiella thermophila TaxID=911321 RepID=UPI003742FD3B